MNKLGIECKAHHLPPEHEGSEFVVRWGSVGIGRKGHTFVNPRSAISRCSNKAAARKRMRDFGVPVPEPLKHPYRDNDSWPVIGRPSFHQEGSGFFICNNYEEILSAMKSGAGYFSHVFHKTNEFRVHCGHGRVILIQDKEDHKFNREGNFRTARHEPWWIPYRSNAIKSVMLAGLGATDSLGLDFSAVDVMWNDKDQTCSVLECNSAPTLDSPLMIRRYAAYFRWLYEYWKEKGVKAPHFKYGDKMDKKEMWWYLKESK